MAENGKFCPKCGAERKAGAQFCGSCGFRFQEAKPSEEDLEKTAKDGINAVKDIKLKAESAIPAGQKIGKYVQEPLHLKITPPAQWEVIVGEMPDALYGGGEKVAEKVTGALGEEVTRQVKEGGKHTADTVKEILTEEVSGKKPETKTPTKTAPPSPSQPGEGKKMKETVPADARAGPARQVREGGGTGTVTAREAPGEQPPGTKPKKESPELTLPSSRPPDIAPPASAPGGRSGDTATKTLESCPSCGSPLKPGDTFCGSCGAQVVGPASTPPPGRERCPSCGAPLKSGSKFCGGCGAPVAQGPVTQEARITCRNCGVVLKEGAKFCGSCGAKVD